MAIPVTLEDARRQLRMEVGDDSRDTELEGFIAAAADWVETYTGHVLVARDTVQQFSGRTCADLSAWPVMASAIPTITYDGADGQPVTLTGKLEVFRRPARVRPLAGTVWSFARNDQQFTVTVRAGYETGEVVPGTLKLAILILITAYDQDREGGDLLRKAEGTARILCEPFRLISI